MDKKTTLFLNYDKKKKDIVFHWPKNRSDGSLLMGAFCFAHMSELSLIEELKQRGYDIETIKFSIKRKIKNEK